MIETALTPALIESLRRLDACRVANAIETFERRLRNEGFADGSIRALFPELSPVVGHAVTARIRGSAPPPVGHTYRDRTDWWSYILTVPPPRIVVVQDVDERPGFGAFVGHVHAEVLRALDCVAVVTNGSVRDLPAVRRMGFPLFAGGVSVSHAYIHILDFAEPVQVGGLPIASGEIVYADVHGVLTVPSEIVAELPQVAARMTEDERWVVELCQSADFTLDRLRAAVGEIE
ncbi:MAG TPA: RraA family protein [Vicinamibacterales bacterium]|jgi:regulator of RNase E activity RraA